MKEITEFTKEVHELLENALSSQGESYLKLSNKEVLDDLRDCAALYTDKPNLTILMVINQWRRKERREIRKEAAIGDKRKG